MSQINLAPNYCAVTVIRARNLPNKGKEIDPFCTISMGKDKFVTAVHKKSSSPEWNEQCDMAIVDDATVKLTVYHSNSNSFSKGDFIGRAYVALRDLQDYDQIHTKWFKLSNKDGKFDKERGEIEVSLQFYSKNNTTGSVLDLTTKKKHLSLKDIKKSLGSKLKSASRNKPDSFADGNKLGEQRMRMGAASGSHYNAQDFLDDSNSESASFGGSQYSLQSIQHSTNGAPHRKIFHDGLTLNATNEFAHSSTQCSMTTDYETLSLCDLTSAFGAEEISTNSSSPTGHNERKYRPSFSTVTNTTKFKQKVNITADDVVEKPFLLKDNERLNSPDSLFGLSTIEEQVDVDENSLSIKDYYKHFFFNETPTSSTSLSSLSVEPKKSSSIELLDHHEEPIDRNVEELLGKTEAGNPFGNSAQGSPSVSSLHIGNSGRLLPDIVGERVVKNPPVSSTSMVNKTSKDAISVLGFDDVLTTKVDTTMQEELRYLGREELLHVIAHQQNILKNREKRVKDLERYTDNLLVKIVEQCPTILQNGTLKPDLR